MAPDRKRQRLSEKDEDEETTVETPTTKTVGDGIEESTNSNEKRTKKQQSKQQQSRSIFVRSLPATTTTDTLTEHFSQSYPIKHATAVLDPLTKQCKGYGFVTFADAEDAQRARVEFDGSTIQGRKIKVDVAEPRHRDLETLSGADSQRRSVPSAAAVDAKAARDRKKVEAERPPKLIVRNLPWSIITSEQLSVLFRSFGK
ncbi:RNA recognition motif-containing protein, partial [Cryomyces antarcticus]